MRLTGEPSSFWKSHPVRVCGLKHHAGAAVREHPLVAPRAGAWIETTRSHWSLAWARVVTRTRAWIETNKVTHKDLFIQNKRALDKVSREITMFEGEAVSRDSINSFLARLFGAEEDAMKFFVYIILA